MRKLSKKLVAACMTAAMMLTMVPAAFAAEPEMQNSERRTTEITEAEVLADLAKEPATMSANALTADENGVYHIYNLNDFDSITQSQWLGENTFIIENNLDLTGSNRTPNEWGGYIPYFRGTLKGANENITISGMENNTYLIYGLNGGTIEDLTLSFSGEAAGLAAISAAYSTPIGVTIENVDTTGNVYLTADNQSNYSPYAYCAPQGGMKMIDCTNNANITGNIYGGIFYGYYPLNRDADDDILFSGCVNKGNVTMRNAAMFFGNPSVDNVMSDADENMTITIENCKNEGTIRGTVSAHYFVSSLQKDLASGGLSEKMEQHLLGTTTADITPHSVTGDALSEENLLVGNKLTGFGVTVGNDNSITIQQPTDPEGIAQYVVSVSTYVYLYDEENQESGGTDRYTVSQTVSASNPTVALKYYGVADDTYGEEGNGVRIGRNTIETRKDTNGEYYSIDKWTQDNLYDGLYQRFAGVNGQAGCQEPDFLTVTALNSAGEVVGITSYGVSES